METWLIVLLCVLGVIVVASILFVIWVVAVYNRFVSLKNQISESMSNLDVYYKKRYDLIPNLVETVKGYAKHEKETLENVINARNMAMNATGSDKTNKENALTGTLKTLFKLTENYPQLKADTQFLSFSKSLEKIEEDILNARKYANAVALEFNTLRDKFPTNLVAKKFKFEKATLFTVGQDVERESVKVKF